jgi:hypothetical protein
MLIIDGIAFHNVTATTTTPGLPGVSLHRVPPAVCAELNTAAQGVGLCPTHAELRFVTSAPKARLLLHSAGHHEYARVYRGDFFVAEHCIEPHQTLAIELDPPAGPAALPPGTPTGGRFSPELWRVRLSGTHRVHYVGIESGGHPVRPPLPHETPARRWLAYGSSITMGFSSCRLGTPWIQLAAAELRLDVLNLGFGGSAHIDLALADHIAARDDWDLCSIEAAINLADQPVPLAEITRRAAAFLDRLTTVSRDVQVWVITSFLSRQDLLGREKPTDHHLSDLRQLWRDAVAACPRKDRIILLEGKDLLDSPAGLTADLVHPSDEGHARIAGCLVRSLTSHQNCRQDRLTSS